MHPRVALSVSNFFVIVSGTLVSYTMLSYLASFMPEAYFGVAISGGGGIALATFMFLPRLVARFGSQRVALNLTFFMIVLLFAAASAPLTVASAVCVILVISLQPLLYYELDLLLEATIENENESARVHTLFLTGGNVGALVAPLLIGTLLAHSESYAYVFFTAAAALLPFIILFTVRTFPAGHIPHHSDFRETFRRLMHDTDLLAVTIGHFILYLFSVWAPLYIPLYLHHDLGIPWANLGWMFSLMLIPYLLIEYPAGWIADRLLGDKEMMLAGFVIAGSALAAIGLLTHTTLPALMVAVLVATRIGAAFIESMTEGHFFRRVSEKDILSVSIFRAVWPLANIVAPLVGMAILAVDGYRVFFLLTGMCVAVLGTIATTFIRDSR